MKKVYVILLGMIFAFCGNAFAGDINDVSSDKWLDHVAQMQVMRQQILNLLTRENPTAEDKEMLAALQKSFSEKKNEWDNYLVDVAEGRVKGTKPVNSFCTDCGKRLCNCGKGIECNKCGKKICNCAKACTDKSLVKECPSQKKGSYHRYNKKPRKHFKREYHRYDKKCKDGCNSSYQKGKKDCCTPDYSCKSSCSSKKCDKTAMKMSCESSCSSKKYSKKTVKKAYKKSACGSCPSAAKSACGSCPSMKKSACNEKEVKCNGGTDCPSCPNYKTSKCCKVSGKCSSGNNHGKHYQKKAKKEIKCPVCYEYKIMGVNRKCSRCSK